MSKEIKRKYPYKAWVLQPSFKPVEVTLVKSAYTHSYTDWDETDKGKSIHIQLLHPSKAAAIAAGRQQLIAQADDLAKRKERLDKRCAALDKAEKE